MKIKESRQILTAADPLPEDLRDALANIGRTCVDSFGSARVDPWDETEGLLGCRRLQLRAGI
nr:hypothetical protein [Mycobacterium riyadhense]